MATAFDGDKNSCTESVLEESEAKTDEDPAIFKSDGKSTSELAEGGTSGNVCVCQYCHWLLWRSVLSSFSRSYLPATTYCLRTYRLCVQGGCVYVKWLVWLVERLKRHDLCLFAFRCVRVWKGIQRIGFWSIVVYVPCVTDVGVNCKSSYLEPFFS